MSVGLGKKNGNKLHELKPDSNSKCSFLGYSRQNQIKIIRCRTGHTRLTHAYLLTNEQPPFCISCNEPFTVLITCTEFNHIRNKYYTAKTVKELFSDTSSDKIINFLKKTNLFNKLYVIKYFFVLMVIPIVLLILSILNLFSLFSS